jgi:diadenosine tetraphosphate (Ap4A) HIT family hydrolase
MPCVFCNDVLAAGDVVFEDEAGWVVLHPDWSPPGHAMVVSGRHVENASDLDEEEWLHFARLWRRAERALLAVTGAERAVILKLGIVTPHLHVHVYPVRAGDTREDVFAAFDGKRGAARDEAFIAAVRAHLTPAAR